MQRFLALLLILPTLANADSIRCGGYLVTPGDSQSQVLHVCGEPQSARQDGFIEQVWYRSDDAVGMIQPVPSDPYTLPPRYAVEQRRLLPVYRWEYNFGHGTFLKILTFHGDLLVDIAAGPRQ